MQIPRVLLVWNLRTTLTLVLVLISALDVSSLNACLPHKCVPNCICDIRFDEKCAEEYGNYGWMVPPEANEYVYLHMRPDVPIGDYEVKPTGMRGDRGRTKGLGTGNGKVLSITDKEIIGQVYFEIVPERMENQDIYVELYGNIENGLGDCAEEGFLLSKSHLFGSSIDRTAQEDNVFSRTSVEIPKAGTSNSSLEWEDDDDDIDAAIDTAIDASIDAPTIDAPAINSALGNSFMLDYRVDEYTSSGDHFSFKVFEYPTYNEDFMEESFECHPRSKDAIVAATEFKISDPFGPDLDGPLWHPTWDDERKMYKKVGLVQFCVRVIAEKPPELPALPAEPGAEQPEPPKPKTLNYMDTKFKFEGNRKKENFGHEGQKNIKVYSNQAIETKASYIMSQNVEVYPFLCGIPDPENISSTLSFGPKKFEIGQNFSICVEPTKDFVSDFEVVGFENVLCENRGQSRYLVKDQKVGDLTTIKNSTVDYIDLSTKQAVSDDAGILIIESIVTTAFVQLDEPTFECTGEALLTKRDTRRGLQEVGPEVGPEVVRETISGVSAPFRVAIDLLVVNRTVVPEDDGLQDEGNEKNNKSLWWLVLLLPLPILFLPYEQVVGFFGVFEKKLPDNEVDNDEESYSDVYSLNETPGNDNAVLREKRLWFYLYVSMWRWYRRIQRRNEEIEDGTQYEDILSDGDIEDVNHVRFEDEEDDSDKESVPSIGSTSSSDVKEWQSSDDDEDSFANESDKDDDDDDNRSYKFNIFKHKKNSEGLSLRQMKELIESSDDEEHVSYDDCSSSSSSSSSSDSGYIT